MVDVRVFIDTREVKENLQALRREGPKAIADTLNGVAFDVLEELKVEVRGAFPFMGQRASRFLTRSFHFPAKATAEHLAVTIQPTPAAPSFLAEHIFGSIIQADRERLTFAGKLAVPVGAKRSAAGRVPAAQEPGALLEQGRGGFATKGAIFQRRRGRRGGQREARLMYLLLERPVQLTKRLRFFETVERTVRRQLPRKAERVLEKINLRRLGR